MGGSIMEQFEPLKTIHLRMHQVRSLKELKLSDDVFNSEALMLVLNKKIRSHDGKRLLFKYLDLQEVPEVMDRKSRVLGYLNHSDYMDIKELVIPDYQVKVDGSLAGFAMPLIENHRNLGSLIHSRGVSFEKKKEILYKLGELIDKVERVDTDNKMYFGDLNEYNFIFDDDSSLRAVDLDSAFIGNREDITPSSRAYYLLKNPTLKALPKKYVRTSGDVIVPNRESDLYSYNMILLDVIANHDMFKEDIATYYQYLDFLKKKGVPDDLIDSFFSIYSIKNNSNPKDLIPDLDNQLTHKSSFKQFQKKYL